MPSGKHKTRGLVTELGLLKIMNQNVDLSAEFAQNAELQTVAAAGGAIFMVFMLAALALSVVMIAGMWALFTKAGKPGWMAIIPILNAWVLVEISGRSALWFVLMFIPLVNLVAILLIWMDVAKSFGKGPEYGIGLLLLPYVFVPVLGFGSAQYTPQASPGLV